MIQVTRNWKDYLTICVLYDEDNDGLIPRLFSHLRYYSIIPLQQAWICLCALRQRWNAIAFH